ncbi:MDR family MFS transporter [Lysinimonas soli]|uniref:MDR family MFS transporter n=1 Tax=Lysinimonas soli TaxID=1074233 RepID=A0ABW0NN78_9MICO
MTQSTLSDSTAYAEGRLDTRSRVAIVLLLAAVFVVFLNETFLSVALPDILKDLKITPSLGQWLTTGFALTMAVVIPITGWLLQRLNTRPVFITAMSLFTAGTLIAATAPGFGLLLVGRIVQASGTAIMMPLMMTTIMTLVPPQSLGRMMGRISIVMSVAPAVGPTISGFLLPLVHWRGLFWVMLPIATAMLILGVIRVPNVTETRTAPLDVLSVILSAVAFSGLVYGLSSFGQAAEGDAALPPWIPLVVGAVVLVAFIFRQLSLQKRDMALLDLRTFKARTYAMSLLMLAISMIALFGTVIVLPLYMQNVLHQSTVVIGLTLLPGGLTMGLLGPLVGRLYDKYGPRPLVIPGAIVVSAVFWSLSMLTDSTPVYLILIAHVTLSLGLAFLFTPLFTAGLGALPPHLYSHGSATLATIQQVAGAAGTAIFIAFLTLGTTSGEAAGLSDGAAIASGVRMAFLAGAIVSLAAVVVAFFVHKPLEPEVTDAELEAVDQDDPQAAPSH